MTDPAGSERERAEQFWREHSRYKSITECMAEFAEAARREELHRTREYLKKLAWSEQDIAAWENWHGQ